MQSITKISASPIQAEAVELVPLDVVIHLITFTDLNTIKNLYTVSKFFFGVCSSEKLWYYLYLSKFGKHKKLQGYNHDWCKLYKERQELSSRPYYTPDACFVAKQGQPFDNLDLTTVSWDVSSNDIQIYGEFCYEPEKELLESIYSLDDDISFTIGMYPFQKEIRLTAPVTLADILQACSKYYSTVISPEDFSIMEPEQRQRIMYFKDLTRGDSYYDIKTFGMLEKYVGKSGKWYKGLTTNEEGKIFVCLTFVDK